MPFPNTHPNLIRALSERGYSEPTPVQTAVLEAEAEGRDLLVSAQTGSGKTIAFGLAIASTLLGDAETFDANAVPLGLVVAPTRELALQVQRELSWVYAHTKARIVSCVGGMDIRREQRALALGAHIVVGTPGRLRDHLERGRLNLSQLRAVVLDEADEMLDLGFREELELILDAAPAERRTLLFSATLPPEIVALARRYQKDAHRITTASDHESHRDIEYRVHAVAPGERDHAVVNVLRHMDARGALVFCSTREGVKHLHANLLERGFAVVSLSGELNQADRSRALQALRDGRARVCVATDVAARGLDLPDLGLVIHAELPNDPPTLLHRSGRTGRAGRKGVCVLLVPVMRRRLGERLIAAAKVEAKWLPPPSADEIRARDQERLIREVATLAEEAAEDEVAAAQSLLAESTPEKIAAALVRMRRSTLPAPEELTETAALPPPLPPRIRPGPSPENVVWFRINVGHVGRADPRWLVPLICRRGRIRKEALGRIKIFDRESHFEITRDAAEEFAAAVRMPDAKDPHVRIEALPMDAPRPPRAFGREGFRSQARPRTAGMQRKA
jgi:ATP-dependent RNA helicase DeaD